MTTKKTAQQIWERYAAGLQLDTGDRVDHHTHRDPTESDFVHHDDESWERKGGESDWELVP